MKVLIALYHLEVDPSFESVFELMKMKLHTKSEEIF